jgi:hypothetical protein
MGLWDLQRNIIWFRLFAYWHRPVRLITNRIDLNSLEKVKSLFLIIHSAKKGSTWNAHSEIWKTHKIPKRTQFWIRRFKVLKTHVFVFKKVTKNFLNRTVYISDKSVYFSAFCFLLITESFPSFIEHRLVFRPMQTADTLSYLFVVLSLRVGYCALLLLASCENSIAYANSDALIQFINWIVASSTCIYHHIW